MSRLPNDFADRLRAAGLKVVEVDGWRTRGDAYFAPRGSVNHHTAGARTGNAPSLGICINGRADLPGPLCHALLARDATIYLIASGRANHAGSGGWDGLVGNSSVVGLEIENVGTGEEGWTAAVLHAATMFHAVALDTIGAEARKSCQHKEWTPRKVDAWGFSGPRFREEIDRAMKGLVAPPNEEELTMADIEELKRYVDKRTEWTRNEVVRWLVALLKGQTEEIKGENDRRTLREIAADREWLAGDQKDPKDGVLDQIVAEQVRRQVRPLQVKLDRLLKLLEDDAKA